MSTCVSSDLVLPFCSFFTVCCHLWVLLLLSGCVFVYVHVCICSVQVNGYACVCVFSSSCSVSILCVQSFTQSL